MDRIITASGILRNVDKPRTGITALNSLKDWAFDEIFQGIDLQWQAIESNVRAEVTARLSGSPDDIDAAVEEELQGIETDGDSASILFGDWKLADGKYVPDVDGSRGFAAHYTGFCGGTVSIEWSKTLRTCGHTSPCFVMSNGDGPCGDLDTKDSHGVTVKAYSLPEDWYVPEDEL